MAFQTFRQQDYPQELGTGQGVSIANDGCAECDVAAICVHFGKQTDPLQLNQALISVEGYADNGNGQHDILRWDYISKIYPDITLAFNNLYPSTPADMTLIDSQLSKGFPVVIGVSFNHNPTLEQPDHYVLLTQKRQDGSYEAMDPWTGMLITYDAVYAVNGMTVAQSILQAISYDGTLPQSDQQIMDDLRKARDDNWNLYQGEIQLNSQLKDQLTQEQAKNSQLQQEVNDLTKKDEDNQKTIIGLKTDSTTLGAVITRISAEDKQYAQEALDAGHQKDIIKLRFLNVLSNLGLNGNATDDQIKQRIQQLSAPHDEAVKIYQSLYDMVFTDFVYKRIPKAKSFLVKLFPFL